ncbi:MAG: ABC transporter ATP-binding protein [Candidatus Hydrothermarchaeaceae archaeon]
MQKSFLIKIYKLLEEIVGRVFMAGMIEAVKLSRDFGTVAALDGVDISVPKGRAFALLGPNGAGKTTLIRILSTLLKPSSGSAKIDGLDIQEERDEVKKRIGAVSHTSLLYEELTARENLEFYAELYGIDADIDELLGDAGLYPRADDYVRTFSRGMMQRLSIARAIIHSPPVLLLDEPTTGLDVRNRLDFYDAIGRMLEKNTTVLLTTHLLEEASQICSEGFVMHRGKIVKKVDLKRGTKEAAEALSKLS